MWMPITSQKLLSVIFIFFQLTGPPITSMRCSIGSDDEPDRRLLNARPMMTNVAVLS